MPGDVAAYRSACLSALQKPGKPDLAFVVTSEEQEALRGNESPYLACKAVFMGQGVPVQNVQIETLRADGLAYALDSIALASYAKLGGTPYVVAAAAAMTQELVIGIGSAHVRQARLTDPERVVGITTVFSADGNYLLSNTSREADYADYAAELLRSLESCIEHVRERNGWQPEDALRLIFHVFKPLRDVEARAVKDLAQKLAGEYAKVEFAFLNLNDDHDWLLFDQNGSGYNGRGVGVPGRGHAVAVSRSEMLISVTGPRDMKLRLQGLPKPLLLKLHRESTFTDLEYLAGQVFRFTSMSWRRPHPSREPVTILYSDLIAGLLGHLRHVKNWNSDIVSSPVFATRGGSCDRTARRQHPGHDLRELVARNGRTADHRRHRTGQHRLAARPLLPRQHPRARPEPGEQMAVHRLAGGEPRPPRAGTSRRRDRLRSRRSSSQCSGERPDRAPAGPSAAYEPQPVRRPAHLRLRPPAGSRHRPRRPGGGRRPSRVYRVALGDPAGCAGSSRQAASRPSSGSTCTCC